MQVRNMGKIYAKAASVASCIGPGDTLRQLPTVDTFKRLPTAEYLSKLSMLQYNQLANLSYWHRAWVRQEIVLARDIDVYCGLASLPWTQLSELWTMHAAIDPSGDHDPSELGNIINLRELRHSGIYPRTLQLIRQFGDLQCADPKDRIYAILPLLSSNDHLVNQIRPDYSQSMFEFFLQVQKALTSPVLFNSDDEEDTIELLKDVLTWCRISSDDEKSVTFLTSGMPLDPLVTSASTQDDGEPIYLTIGGILPIHDVKSLGHYQRKATRPASFPKTSHAAALSSTRALLNDFTAFPQYSTPSGDHIFASTQHPEQDRSQAVRMLLLEAKWDWISMWDHCSPILFVHHDVQQDDVLARVHWRTKFVDHEGLPHQHVYHSYAVLRPYEVPARSPDAASTQTRYALHSWALITNFEMSFEDMLTWSRGEEMRYGFADITNAPPVALTAKNQFLLGGGEQVEIRFASKQITRFLLHSRNMFAALSETEQHRKDAVFDEDSSARIGRLHDNSKTKTRDWGKLLDIPG